MKSFTFYFQLFLFVKIYNNFFIGTSSVTKYTYLNTIGTFTTPPDIAYVLAAEFITYENQYFGNFMILNDPIFNIILSYNIFMS